MEFPVTISKVFPVDSKGYIVLDAATYGQRARPVVNSSYLQHYTKSNDKSAKDPAREILDQLGEASAKAQGLKQVITTYDRFTTSGDQRVYMKAEGNRVYGILKVGKKNLFYRDYFGKVKEMKPLCVLDFYVSENVQRSGLGRAIFEKMLEVENIEPNKLAIDRPSTKLISFLKKHYGLVNYVPQNNNFVIFNAYWDNSDRQYSNKNTESRHEEDKLHSNNYKDTLQPKKATSYKDDEKSYQTSYGRPAKEDYSALPLATDQSNRELQSRPTNRNHTNSSKLVTKNSNQDFGVSSIENKMKDTESKIKDCEEKIRELSFQKQELSGGNPQQRRDKEYHSKAPWASTASQGGAYKTSNVYGSHYKYK